VLIDPRGADTPVLLAMLCQHRLRLCWVLRTHEHDAALPQGARPGC
jgi:sulfur dioxygenase